MYFVVKEGKIPGIYTNKEEFEKQVKGFENPLVKVFKNENDANDFFNKPIEEIKAEMQKLKEKKKKSETDKAEQIRFSLKKGIILNSDNICFIDIEANESKAISIGAVFYDSKNKKILETFYSLMKYEGFKEMDKYSQNIHNISKEMIETANPSDEVINTFISLVQKYNVKDIFSWGSSDKHYLRKTLTDKTILDKMEPIKNIQTAISNITYDVVKNKCWSLQNMKIFYGIEKEVTHNALDDANDLLKIFECFQNKKEINKEIVLRQYALLTEKEDKNEKNS